MVEHAESHDHVPRAQRLRAAPRALRALLALAAALAGCGDEPAECGNGEREAGEGCDDGNFANGDGCDLNCTPSACGNGVRAAGEVCDDGNVDDSDGCDSNCTATACGNGVRTAGEQCDDANNVTEVCPYGTSCAICDSTCALVPGETSFCGDGVTQLPFESCDDANGSDEDWCTGACRAAPLVALTYVKASNTGEGDELGSAIAFSADGSTLAVGAPREDSAAVGVGGAQADNSAADAGAVYVFRRSGTAWIQEAYVKSSSTRAQDRFGSSVALSADGSILAVGAPQDLVGAGAVYLFTRSGTAWSQAAQLTASNPDVFDYFGSSVALSADGSILAVSAYGEDSAATGVGGDQSDDSGLNSGAVYVFARSGATWLQEAYVKASNADPGDAFGGAGVFGGVRLSADGATLAVGAPEEASAATGVNGDQADNSIIGAGAVYVFRRGGGTWSQEAYLKSMRPGQLGYFANIALSSDGATLAVGTTGEPGPAAGGDPPLPYAGAVYVFTRSGTAWRLHAHVTASNLGEGDRFGASVALSGDGMTLAVGATDEDSAATRIGGDQVDNAASQAGAVYVLARGGAAWGQAAYVKASNTGRRDHFGRSVALSDDGSILTVGATDEASAATGIGGDQGDDSALHAGAVYVFQ